MNDRRELAGGRGRPLGCPATAPIVERGRSVPYKTPGLREQFKLACLLVRLFFWRKGAQRKRKGAKNS